MPDDPVERFAALRPADEALTDADRDDLWARIGGGGVASSAVLADVVDLADPSPDAGRRRRVLAVAAAAALVVAVLVVAANRDGRRNDRGGAGPATTVTATSVALAPTSSAALVPSTPPPFPADGGGAGRLTADDVRWYLPTWLPDGVDLWVAHAQPLIDPGFAIRPSARWVRRGADGRTVTEVVTLMVSPSDTPGDNAGASVKVHGEPAFVTVNGSGDQIADVGWYEQGHQWSLTGIGVDQDDLVRLADASAVRVDPAELTLPAATGFEPVPVPSGRLNLAMGSALTAGRYADGRFAQWIELRAEGARADETLDNSVYGETRRVTLDGIERSITDAPFDDPRFAHVAQWYDDGFKLTLRVTGKLDRGALDRLVAGVRRATPDQVRTAYDQVSARGAAGRVVDGVTAADGIELSVRETSGGLRYVCAAGDAGVRCAVGSPVHLSVDTGERAPVALTRLALGDQIVIVGWRTPGSGPTPTAPGRESLVEITGNLGVFAYARGPAGQTDGFFPAPTDQSWDDFWATPAPSTVPTGAASTSVAGERDPRLVTLPWLLAAMTDPTGRVRTPLAPESYGPGHELRPPGRTPRLSADAAITAAEVDVRSLIGSGSGVTITLAEYAAGRDATGDEATAVLVYDVAVHGVGCFPSTATTAEPGATSASQTCVVHLRVDADTGAVLERWEEFGAS